MPTKVQPYFEFALMLGLLQLGGHLIIPDDPFFIHTTISPYWLLILLIAFRYGTPGGLFVGSICAFLTLLGFYGLNNSLSAILYLHSTEMIVPVAMILVGHYCGEAIVRNSHKITFFKNSHSEALQKLDEQIKNNAALEEKYRFLESNVAGRESNLFRLHGPIERLNEVRSKEELIDCAQHALVEILQASDIKIFDLTNGVWHKNDCAVNDAQIPPLLQKSLHDKRVISCASADVSSEHPAVLAGLIYNHQDQIVMGLSIGSMPFKNMASLSVDIFKTILHWIGMSLDRIVIMQSRGAYDASLQELGVSGETFFCNYITKSVRLLSRESKPSSLITISLKEFDLSPKAQWRLELLIAQIIIRISRASDLATYSYPRQTFLLYLPTTDHGGAQIVEQKIVEALNSYQLEILIDGKRTPMQFDNCFAAIALNNLQELTIFLNTFYPEELV